VDFPNTLGKGAVSAVEEYAGLEDVIVFETVLHECIDVEPRAACAAWTLAVDAIGTECVVSRA